MLNPVGVSAFSMFRKLVMVSLATVGVGAVSAQSTAPTLLPYTAKLIAGGGTAVYGKGIACPSGLMSTDAYGDGCLANEIEIGNTATGGTTPGARSAVADGNGNVFFTDYNNGLVRRVDALTGVVTAVAGGASTSPTSGTACGTGISIDAIGDGCTGTLVKLSHPASIAFAPNGDLYFGDVGQGQVRKIAATNGAITNSGIISLAAGNVSGTYGYAASNATATITSANSYLRAPYGLSFDTKGDLFIVDEYTEAILVLNTNTTGTNTVNNVAVAAGTIWKIAGTVTSGGPYCVNGTASGYGCNYGLYTENTPANSDSFDSTYSVAVGPDGTVYGGDEYYDSVFQVSPAGILSTFAGKQNSVGTKPTLAKRGTAGSFGVGSVFGVAADPAGDVYFTDASSGIIWRVDRGSLAQYNIAGGASTFCTGATDAYGDGCPALQAKFGSSGTGNYATATLPGPGVYGVSVDANYNVYVGDTETNLVREVASGTQFGVVGANQPTQTLDVHFAVGDGPAASAPYVVSSGASNFTVGTASCTTNSDNTMDCLLPVTATPSVLGSFSGTLTVTSSHGATNNFTLSGTYAQSPATRTSVSYSAPSVPCTGTNTYSTTTPVVLTAKLTANGPSAPTGTVTFFANGQQVGTPQSVTNVGTTSTPVYGATLTNTFSTANTYTIKATYSGDSYFTTSTSTGTNVVISTPTFTAAAVAYQSIAPVTAGGTALYSFNIAQSVYAGTISFSCTNLPQGASCVFSPTTVTATGCSTGTTVALSILTTARNVTASGVGLGTGRWQLLGTISALGLALLIGLRRRNFRYGQIGLAIALLIGLSSLMACGGNKPLVAGTPAGSTPITVLVTGSTGTTASFQVTLNVQ